MNNDFSRHESEENQEDQEDQENQENQENQEDQYINELEEPSEHSLKSFLVPPPPKETLGSKYSEIGHLQHSLVKLTRFQGEKEHLEKKGIQKEVKNISIQNVKILKDLESIGQRPSKKSYQTHQKVQKDIEKPKPEAG